VNPSFDALATAHLELEPITEETARAILAGDLSDLRPGEGWPHDGTINGLSMAVRGGHRAGWLIMVDGTVVGDCGVHGWVDDDGALEIGYGLAPPYRGRGYGTEAVGAMTDWLLTQPDVRSVRARTSQDNAPSRRVLEKVGFQLIGIVDENTLYRCGARR